MQPHQPKSIGSAIVDVFDAALGLVKTELRLLSRRVGSIIRAKGVGVVLLLAAAAPLSLALIFLILALFYALLLFLPAWASALIIAVLALVVTGVLVMLGVRRLTAEVKDETASGEQLAREEVKDAEKKLEKAEKQSEKDDKRIEKAERDLAKAQEDLRRETRVSSSSPGTSSQGIGEASSPSGAVAPPPTTSTRPPPGAPTSGAGRETVIAPTQTPHSSSAPSVRPADEDGIPVSTKPDLPEEDRS